MSAERLTAPAVEPLTLAEAKAWLRVEHIDDDALIGKLIAGARAQVEALTRRALITQGWRLVRDAWPRGGRLLALPAPVRAVTAARVFRADGSSQTVAPSLFTIDRAAAPSIIAADFTALPQPGRGTAGIELDVTAGYGDAAADVPEPLVQAVRLLLAQSYERRDGGAVGLPPPVVTLLAPFKVLSL